MSGVYGRRVKEPKVTMRSGLPRNQSSSSAKDLEEAWATFGEAESVLHRLEARKTSPYIDHRTAHQSASSSKKQPKSVKFESKRVPSIRVISPSTSGSKTAADFELEDLENSSKGNDYVVEPSVMNSGRRQPLSSANTVSPNSYSAGVNGSVSSSASRSFESVLDQMEKARPTLEGAEHPKPPSSASLSSRHHHQGPPLSSSLHFSASHTGMTPTTTMASGGPQHSQSATDSTHYHTHSSNISPHPPLSESSTHHLHRHTVPVWTSPLTRQVPSRKFELPSSSSASGGIAGSTDAKTGSKVTFNPSLYSTHGYTLEEPSVSTVTASKRRKVVPAPPPTSYTGFSSTASSHRHRVARPISSSISKSSVQPSSSSVAASQGKYHYDRNLPGSSSSGGGVKVHVGVSAKYGVGGGGGGVTSRKVRRLLEEDSSEKRKRGGSDLITPSSWRQGKQLADKVLGSSRSGSSKKGGGEGERMRVEEMEEEAEEADWRVPELLNRHSPELYQDSLDGNDGGGGANVGPATAADNGSESSSNGVLSSGAPPQRHLSANINRLLADLDENGTANGGEGPGEEAAMRGGGEERRKGGGRGGTTRRQPLAKKPKYTEPAFPTEKVRHYDQSEVQRYIQQKKGERHRKMQRELEAQQRAHRLKEEKLRDLYETQRRKVESNLRLKLRKEQRSKNAAGLHIHFHDTSESESDVGSLPTGGRGHSSGIQKTSHFRLHPSPPPVSASSYTSPPRYNSFHTPLTGGGYSAPEANTHLSYLSSHSPPISQAHSSSLRYTPPSRSHTHPSAASATPTTTLHPSGKFTPTPPLSSSHSPSPSPLPRRSASSPLAADSTHRTREERIQAITAAALDLKEKIMEQSRKLTTGCTVCGNLSFTTPPSGGAKRKQDDDRYYDGIGGNFGTRRAYGTTPPQYAAASSTSPILGGGAPHSSVTPPKSVAVTITASSRLGGAYSSTSPRSAGLSTTSPRVGGGGGGAYSSQSRTPPRPAYSNSTNEDSGTRRYHSSTTSPPVFYSTQAGRTSGEFRYGRHDEGDHHLPGVRNLQRHALEAEQARVESEAARKIQALYRGYCVRRSLQWELPSGGTLGDVVGGVQGARRGGDGVEDKSDDDDDDDDDTITPDEDAESADNVPPSAAAPTNTSATLTRPVLGNGLHHRYLPKEETTPTPTAAAAHGAKATTEPWLRTGGDTHSVINIFTRQYTHSEYPDMILKEMTSKQPPVSSPPQAKQPLTSSPWQPPSEHAQYTYSEDFASTTSGKKGGRTEEAEVESVTSDLSSSFSRDSLYSADASPQQQKTPSTHQSVSDHTHTATPTSQSISEHISGATGFTTTLTTWSSSDHTSTATPTTRSSSDHTVTVSTQSGSDHTPTATPPSKSQSRSASRSSSDAAAAVPSAHTSSSKHSKKSNGSAITPPGSPSFVDSFTTGTSSPTKPVPPLLNQTGTSHHHQEPRLSPRSLELKHQAELNLLEAVEDARQHVAQVENTRAISLAQQETVVVAQLLKTKEQEHQKEVRNLRTHNGIEEDRRRRNVATNTSSTKEELERMRARMEEQIHEQESKLALMKSESDRALQDLSARLSKVGSTEGNGDVMTAMAKDIASVVARETVQEVIKDARKSSRDAGGERGRRGKVDKGGKEVSDYGSDFEHFSSSTINTQSVLVPSSTFTSVSTSASTIKEGSRGSTDSILESLVDSSPSKATGVMGEGGSSVSISESLSPSSRGNKTAESISENLSPSSKGTKSISENLSPSSKSVSENLSPSSKGSRSIRESLSPSSGTAQSASEKLSATLTASSVGSAPPEALSASVDGGADTSAADSVPESITPTIPAEDSEGRKGAEGEGEGEESTEEAEEDTRDSFRKILPSEDHRKRDHRRCHHHHKLQPRSRTSSVATTNSDIEDHPSSPGGGGSRPITPALSDMSLFSPQGGEDSFFNFTSRMVRLYMQEEETRARHQAALLQLRESALKEKTKAELDWLKLQEKELRSKGADDQMPPLKKREKGLLKKLKQEQEEIRALKEVQEAARQERKHMILQQQEISKMRRSARYYRDKIHKYRQKSRHSPSPEQEPDNASSVHFPDDTVTSRSMDSSVGGFSDVDRESSAAPSEQLEGSFPTYSPLTKTPETKLSSSSTPRGRASNIPTRGAGSKRSPHLSASPLTAKSGGSSSQKSRADYTERYLVERGKEVGQRDQKRKKQKEEDMEQRQRKTASSSQRSDVSRTEGSKFTPSPHSRSLAPVNTTTSPASVVSEHIPTSASLPEVISEVGRAPQSSQIKTEATPEGTNRTSYLDETLTSSRLERKPLSSSTPTEQGHTPGAESARVATLNDPPFSEVSDTMTITSEGSAIEARIRLLQLQLTQRKDEMKRARNEHNRKKKAMLKRQEEQLKKKLEDIESQVHKMKHPETATGPTHHLRPHAHSADVSDSDFSSQRARSTTPEEDYRYLTSPSPEVKVQKERSYSVSSVEERSKERSRPSDLTPSYTPFTDSDTHVTELQTSAIQEELESSARATEPHTSVVQEELESHATEPESVYTDEVEEEVPEEEEEVKEEKKTSEVGEEIEEGSEIVSEVEEEEVRSSGRDISEYSSKQETDFTDEEVEVPEEKAEVGEEVKEEIEEGASGVEEEVESSGHFLSDSSKQESDHAGEEVALIEKEKVEEVEKEEVSEVGEEIEEGSEMASEVEEPDHKASVDELANQGGGDGDDDNDKYVDYTATFEEESEFPSSSAAVKVEGEAEEYEEDYEEEVEEEEETEEEEEVQEDSPVVYSNSGVSEDANNRPQLQATGATTLASSSAHSDFSDSIHTYSTTPSQGGDLDEEGDIFQPGQQVLIANKIEGVVKFVGTTQFAPGLWVGVEIDVPKGRNDGSINGKRYFSCRPNYGLFVPPHKLTLVGGGSEVEELELQQERDNLVASEKEEAMEAEEEEKEEVEEGGGGKEEEEGERTATSISEAIEEDVSTANTVSTSSEQPAPMLEETQGGEKPDTHPPASEVTPHRSHLATPTPAPPPEFAEGASVEMPTESQQQQQQERESRERSSSVVSERISEELAQDLTNEAYEAMHKIWKAKHSQSQVAEGEEEEEDEKRKVEVEEEKELPFPPPSPSPPPSPVPETMVPLSLNEKANLITDQLLAELLKAEANFACDIHTSKRMLPVVQEEEESDTNKLQQHSPIKEQSPETAAQTSSPSPSPSPSPTKRTTPPHLVLNRFAVESSPPPLSPPSPYRTSPQMIIPPSPSGSSTSSSDFSPPGSPPRHLPQASKDRVTAGERAPFAAPVDQQQQHQDPTTPPVSPAPLSSSLQRSSSVESVFNLMQSISTVRTAQCMVSSEQEHINKIVSHAWDLASRIGFKQLHSTNIECPSDVTMLFNDLRELGPAEERCQAGYVQMVFQLALETIKRKCPLKEMSPVWLDHCTTRSLLGPSNISTSARPLTLEEVQQSVYAALMRNQLPLQLPAVKFLHKKRRPGGREVDFVDQILIKELRNEEPAWVDYSKDEIVVKERTADSILETLLDETVELLGSIAQKRQNRMLNKQLNPPS